MAKISVGVEDMAEIMAAIMMTELMGVMLVLTCMPLL